MYHTLSLVAHLVKSHMTSPQMFNVVIHQLVFSSVSTVATMHTGSTYLQIA